MKITKILRFILAILFVLIIIGGIYFFWFAKKITPVFVPKPMDVPTQEVTPVQEGKGWDSSIIFNEKVDPKTITSTAQLQEIFGRFFLYGIPGVYINAFPQDFVQQGDPSLFVKSLLPIILKENKNILTDREFLVRLYRKNQKNEKWSPEEQVHFEELTRKYDLVNKKEPDAQMAELLDRVDAVPVSLALAQAGVQTNWGKVSLDAPFGQYDWINGKYQIKKFKTLPEAVHSYMQELNTMPQYYTMRVQRRTYRDLSGSMGNRLIPYMDKYMPQDASYVDALKNAYTVMDLAPLEEAILLEF